MKARHWIPLLNMQCLKKSSGKWGTECLNTRFPLLTLLAGYSVKLIWYYIVLIYFCVIKFYDVWITSVRTYCTCMGVKFVGSVNTIMSRRNSSPRFVSPPLAISKYLISFYFIFFFSFYFRRIYKHWSTAT